MRNNYIIFDIEVTQIAQIIGFSYFGITEHISLLDRNRLIDFFKKMNSEYNNNKNVYVSYNGYEYDNKILNYCISNKNLTSKDVIDFSNSIINKTTKIKETEFNIYVPKLKDATIENLDIYSMMNQKKSLKLNAFLKYKYLFKKALGCESIEELTQYNIEDLKLTERIFYEEFEQEYELNLYLSKYLGFEEIGHKNLIIYKFLKEIAKYNNKFNFRKCLDKIKLDKDLKELAMKLISNNKLTQIYTQDMVLIKKGGIHFPIDGDFSKLGIQYYKECYNYDFSSYYPNLYINLLDFFSSETKDYLKNILDERLQAKKSGDEHKNKALKLFINSVYGQLKNINKEYMFAVAILGQVLFVQLMRDNNITLKEVVEINTDGILLKNKIKYITNISKIEIEEEVFTDVYHKNSNNKTYMLNNEPVIKGTILGSNEHTEKIVFKDLSACLYGGVIHNCFIVKRKYNNKYNNKYNKTKYYKFGNIEDIKNYKLGHGGILMIKSVFNEAIESGVLVETSEYNEEDITDIVTDLFNDYLKKYEGYERYIDSEFELKSNSEEVNEIYNEYKNDLYLLPNDKNICIQHEDKSIHNELAFYNNNKPKNLFIVTDDVYIIVEVNYNEIVNKKVKELLVDKTAKYLIYRKPIFSIKTKALKGLKYYKNLEVASINSVNEFELIEVALPNIFYTRVNDERVGFRNLVGMTKEALDEKDKAEKKKIKTEQEKDLIKDEQIKSSPCLEQEKLISNYKEMIDFLISLEPIIAERNCHGKAKYIKHPKELRAINKATKGKKSVHSTLCYSLLKPKDEKDYINYIWEFFKNLNGTAYDAYYSIFNFEPERSNSGAYQGKVKKKTIDKNTAKSTMILPMDFDDIGEEEYKQIKQRFTDLGLETLDVFSGHGYQMIILLDNYCYDKEILNKFTTLLAKKGFPVDEAIIDSARIMRLPYTYNCKCLDSSSKYYGKEDPIFTKVVNKTRTRYNLSDVFNKLSSLESVEKQVIKVKEITEVIQEVVVPQIKEIKEIKKIKEIKNKNKESKILDFIEPKVLSNNKIKNLQDIYANTKLDISELEPVIQNILTGTKEGMRHEVLLFIMPYLKNYKKYSLEQIEDILTIWGSKCKPSMSPSEVKLQVRSLYNYKAMTAPYGKYTNNLKREYGAFKLSTSKNQATKVCITNNIIKHLNMMESQELKIYIALLLEYIEIGRNVFTIDDIKKITKSSSSTFNRSIIYLKRYNYIKVSKKCKKNGEKYEYRLNLNMINFNKIKTGFVSISQDVVKKALDILTTGELSTWLYISMIQGATNKVCDLNQYRIGFKIKRSNTAISNITSSLDSKGFIYKETKWKIKDIYKDIYEQYCLYDVSIISRTTNKLAS